VHAFSLTVASLVVFCACGARTTLDGSGSKADAGGFPGHPACASASGVRLCDGICPPLSVPDCKGHGCTHPVDESGDAAPMGVCWADTPETDFLCDGCAAGDACLQRTTGAWVCVPSDVCEALWDAGVTDVCRYADKRTYDHRAVPDASGCPAKETAVHEYEACGGDCPPCSTMGNRCNGVAPDHPFGICNDDSEPYNASFACGVSPFCGGLADFACAVPDVPDSDLSVAREYGTCMDRPGCLDFATRFPGGLGCYDASGNRLN